MNVVADLFRRVLAANPDKPALVADEIRLSYSDLLGRVLAIHDLLREQQVCPGDVVGLNVKDEVVHYLASISLMMTGCRQVTFASHDSAGIFRRMEKILEPRFVVTDMPGPDNTCAVIPLDSSMVESKSPKQEIHLLIDRLAGLSTTVAGSVLLKTSGTTGGFKIVEANASDLRLQALRHPEYLQESLLRFASIEHNNSKRHRLYVFFNGGLNIFRSQAEDSWIGFAESGLLNILDISRLHVLELLKRFQNGELSSVKIRTGGSSIPTSLRRDAMKHLSDKFFVRYAATEFGGIAMAEPDMHEMHGCAGRLLPGVALEIVDDNDRIIPAGEAGHIRIKGAGASGAYAYSESGNTNVDRFRNGYFYPGDIGRITSSALLIVEGRRDDMMIMNGLNIFPDEIQGSLVQINGVREAVSFSVESRQHGEIPAAAVTLQPGVSLSEQDLIREAKKHLALKCPRRIYILDEIPVNSAGKYDKSELKSRLLKT